MAVKEEITSPSSEPRDSRSRRTFSIAWPKYVDGLGRKDFALVHPCEWFRHRAVVIVDEGQDRALQVRN